ncbi:hypothetical protein UBN14_12550 [Helicobacter pylori]
MLRNMPQINKKGDKYEINHDYHSINGARNTTTLNYKSLRVNSS